MKTLPCIVLTLICLATRLVAADTVDLQQKWVAGKQYFIKAQTSQQSTVKIGTEEMNQTVAMTMEMNVAVRTHEDGKRKRLVIKYDRMAMDMTMNAQKFGYDSAKPEAGTDPLGMGKSLGGMIGKELRMVTNEKGEIAEIENYDEYLKELTAGAGAAAADMAKMFTREGLVEMMKQGSLQGLPDHPVAAGDSWPFTNKISLPQIGTVTVKGTYTYKGTVDHGGVPCAEIQTDGTIAMDLGAAGEAGAGAPADLATRSMKVTDGTIKGPVWFDAQLGTTRDAELAQEMTISMKSPENSAAVLTIPMKQTVKTTLTKVVDLK